MAWPLFTPRKDPVPIVQEVGWIPGSVWTEAENLAPTGIRSPDRTARSSVAIPTDEGSASRPGRSLPPGKTRYSLYRKLGGFQDRSGRVRKISPPPGFDPQTVQPVAHSLYRLMRGQRHAPAALYPQERPGTHCTGGWVGPRSGLDRSGKSRPHRDSIHGPSSP